VVAGFRAERSGDAVGGRRPARGVAAGAGSSPAAAWTGGRSALAARWNVPASMVFRANWANQNGDSVVGTSIELTFDLVTAARRTVNIAGVTVVFYNGSGTEISSTTENVGQTLTGGQSYAENISDSGDPRRPSAGRYRDLHGHRSGHELMGVATRSTGAVGGLLSGLALNWSRRPAGPGPRGPGPRGRWR
jgi:hypothetical protein